MTAVKMRDTPCESETGTTIRFHADPEIFETTEFDYDVLEKRLREQAFLNAGLKITLRDERDDEPVEDVMHYEGGIRQFVEHLNRTKTLCTSRLFNGGQPRYLDGRGRDAVYGQL